MNRKNIKFYMFIGKLWILMKVENIFTKLQHERKVINEYNFQLTKQIGSKANDSRDIFGFVK